MDKKTVNNWIMYHEIQRLIREGLSLAAISKRVVMNPRTVKRYSRMSEAEYASFLQSKEVRDKLLSPYENFCGSFFISSLIFVSVPSKSSLSKSSNDEYISKASSKFSITP